MTTLIFEGPDNVGKSTIINKFIENYRNCRDITMIHATGPRLDVEDSFLFQKQCYYSTISKLFDLKRHEDACKGKSNANLVLLDRAWFGEYVYGQLYRNGNPEKIKETVSYCNSFMKECRLEFVVIHLDASTEFIFNHDDNLSLSSNMDSDKRKMFILRERELFNEIFQYSKDNNFIENYIKINVHKDKSNYINADIIFNNILDKLKDKNIKL